ncbi:MAG: glycosyl hydrolase family 28-related protein [Sphingomicrobium sp.]
MADFQPKFVDLVRNTTTTVGTGNFILGAAATGFTSFLAALQVGDSFYYSVLGVDKPTEREVGRGTLLSGGAVSRDPIGGTRTNFSSGTKTISLIAAAEWYSQMQSGGSAATRVALASSRPQGAAMLCESGREGLFVWDGSDQSAAVGADPGQGIAVAPASDPTGRSGAWLRKFDGSVNVRWFGARSDGTTDDSAAFVAAIACLKARAGNLSLNGFYKGSSRLFVPAGHYFLGTTTLDITHSLIIEGEGSGRFMTEGGGITRLRWAHGASGIRGQAYDTSGELTVDTAPHSATGGLSLSRLLLEGGYAGVEGDFHGIHPKTTVTLDDLYIRYWSGDGVSGRASMGTAMEGNFSVSSFKNVRFEGNRIGLDVRGSDANVVTCSGVEFVLNRQAGYVDDSAIGSNTLIGCHASTNGFGSAATVPTQCSHSGNRYAVKWGEEAWCSANAPSGGAADNQGWLYIEPGVADAANGIPEWTSGAGFRPGGDYLTVNDVTVVQLINCYAEEGPFSQFGSSTLLTAGAIAERYRHGGGRLRMQGGAIRYDENVEFGNALKALGTAHVFGTPSTDTTTTHFGQTFYQLGFVANGASAADIYGYSGVGMILKGYPSIDLRHGPTNSSIATVTSSGVAVAGALAATGPVSSSGGGIGYAPGAGGAVVQATSKSTGVTLNRLCGQITLSPDALAAGAGAAFTVANSEVAATDLIDLVLSSGSAAPGSYAYQVDGVAAGSFTIWVENVTGSSLGEALVFNFAVTKAVSA